MMTFLNDNISIYGKYQDITEHPLPTPAMPVLDQVQDDGSGIQLLNRMKRHWIPDQEKYLGDEYLGDVGEILKFRAVDVIQSGLQRLPWLLFV
jgi:hypothetical protein